MELSSKRGKFLNQPRTCVQKAQPEVPSSIDWQRVYVLAYKLFDTDAGLLFLEDGDPLQFSEFTLAHLTGLLSRF